MDDFREKVAEAVHDAWAKQKRAIGYHHPDECPDGCPTDCDLCHVDLKPYADLSEAKKELDRATVAAVAPIYEEVNARLEAEVRTCSHRFMIELPCTIPGERPGDPKGVQTIRREVTVAGLVSEVAILQRCIREVLREIDSTGGLLSEHSLVGKVREWLGKVEKGL